MYGEHMEQCDDEISKTPTVESPPSSMPAIPSDMFNDPAVLRAMVQSPASQPPSGDALENVAIGPMPNMAAGVAGDAGEAGDGHAPAIGDVAATHVDEFSDSPVSEHPPAVAAAEMFPGVIQPPPVQPAAKRRRSGPTKFGRCTRCGLALVPRVILQGPFAGEPTLGCSKWKECGAPLHRTIPPEMYERFPRSMRGNIVHD